MVIVSATNLRKNLFEYLDKAAAGETIVIQRNNQEVARIVPTLQPNWRQQMTIAPKLLVAAAELMQPLDDVWDEYV